MDYDNELQVTILGNGKVFNCCDIYDKITDSLGVEITGIDLGESDVYFYFEQNKEEEIVEMTNKINMENVQTYKSDLGYDWKTFLNQPKNDDEQESYDYLMSQDNNDTLDIFFMFYPSKPEKGKVEIMIGTEDSNIRCWVDTECYYIAEDKEAYIKNLTSEKINDWLDTLFEFYNSTISF